MWGLHVLLQGMKITYMRSERHRMGCGARIIGLCTIQRVQKWLHCWIWCTAIHVG